MASILSYPDFTSALHAAYSSSTLPRMEFDAARYTTDRRTLDFLWKIKPSRYNVKCIRGASHLTREGFARRYGIPVPTLGQWERDERSPSEYVVHLLAYAIYCDYITGALDDVQD